MAAVPDIKSVPQETTSTSIPTAVTREVTAVNPKLTITQVQIKDDDGTQPEFDWNPAIDAMLADWCDQSKCFAWMHTQAYGRYSTRSVVMSITTNSFISLSGVANLVLGTMTTSSNTAIIFGCISIGIGIVNMIQEKFAFAALATDFKRSSQEWSMVTRKLEEQLVIPYSGRKDCGTFLKYIKQDISTISETNTSIPEDIRNACTEKFGKIPNFDIPDICGQLEHTVVYTGTATVVPPIEQV